jgi:hypothetical protein
MLPSYFERSSFLPSVLRISCHFEIVTGVSDVAKKVRAKVDEANITPSARLQSAANHMAHATDSRDGR